MTADLRVLIDTNVLLSYLLGRSDRVRPISRLIEAALNAEFVLLIPEELLTELQEKLTTKSYFTQRLAPDETTSFMVALRTIGHALDPIEGTLPEVVRDPRDDFLIAAALIGEADYLVTGDSDLLDLATQIEPLKIVRPADFVRDVLEIDQP